MPGKNSKNKGLPKFEGQEVKQRELSVGGSVSLAMGAEDPHALDDKIVFIGTASVKSIGHQRKGDADVLTRIEKATAIELYVVTDSTDALDVLQGAKADREQALDDLLGRQKLPMDDQGAATDDALNTLLEEEAARDAAGENPAVQDPEAAIADGIDPVTGERKPEEMTDEEWQASIRKSLDEKNEDPDAE